MCITTWFVLLCKLENFFGGGIYPGNPLNILVFYGVWQTAIAIHSATNEKIL